MNAAAAQFERGNTDALLRGEPVSLLPWVREWRPERVGLCSLAVVVGAGLYGAAMGWWRDPWQAAYVAIKFPLIVLLTTLGNALLNAMMAPLLGLNLTVRQSFQAVLMSFAIASVILGSFSPLTAFVVWNSPPISSDLRASGGTHSFILLMHVAIIAFAGIVANLHLVRLLRGLSGSQTVARRVLLAWLAGNLFLGSQLSWILRPFIGSPGLPVEFVRADAFRGNFYETVFRSVLRLFGSD